MPWITRSREARWTSTTADSAASPRRPRYVVARHVRPALGQGSSRGSAGQADEPEGDRGKATASDPFTVMARASDVDR
jgi:hypothetical protein